MKTSQQIYASLLLGLLPVAFGQSSLNNPGLAPAESVGCEAHGDHWHCDGPRLTSTTGLPLTFASVPTAAPAATTTSVTPTHNDHHDDDDDEDEDVDDHDHDHDHSHDEGEDHDVEVEYETTVTVETVTTKPSPTASVGCVAHGNHWHCDGAASSTQTTLATSTTDAADVPSGVSTVTTSGGARSRGITLLGLLATAVGVAVAL